MHVVVAGGTGFLGRWLIRYLQHRHPSWQFTILSRGTQAPPQVTAQVVTWNGFDRKQLDGVLSTLQPVNVVINLIGRSVDCPKNPATYDEILRSRVDATTILRQAFDQSQHEPSCWLQMSTAHIYGDPPSQIMDETSSHGYGMAPIVGKAWEAACTEHTITNCRDVLMRTGFVLGSEGGPLAILTRLARFGLGGSVASGQQGMSWIHIADWCRLCEEAMLSNDTQGIYNYVAPNPVSQQCFMRALRRAVGMPIGLPAPTFLVKLGSLILKTDHKIICYGRYVTSSRLHKDAFLFPSLNKL